MAVFDVRQAKQAYVSLVTATESTQRTVHDLEQQIQAQRAQYEKDLHDALERARVDMEALMEPSVPITPIRSPIKLSQSTPIMLVADVGVAPVTAPVTFSSPPRLDCIPCASSCSIEEDLITNTSGMFRLRHHRIRTFSPYGSVCCACAQRPGLPRACHSG